MDIKAIAKNIISNIYSPFMRDITDDVFKHSEHVCDLALIIADAYEFDLQKKIDIATGALLHDIGKSYVNQNILLKEEKLTKDDRMIIECHPQIGFQVIKKLPFNKDVINIVHYHHERLTGNGYPEKLLGPKISILTQIVSVADVYEALTTTRVYHEKYTPDEAFEIMQKDAGLNQIAIDILKQHVKKISK